MALLYIANKLIDNTGITFTEAKTNTEKAISIYTKFKYEQSLLSFEFTFYTMIISMLTKTRRPVQSFNGCYYKYDDKVRAAIGSTLALPFTLYRTIQYINNKDIKFIDFDKD